MFKNNQILCFLIFFVFSSNSMARVVEIDFSVKFNNAFDFASNAWEPFKESTTAKVKFDVDATSLRGIYYWETPSQSKLQSISTFFGTPLITSPFLDRLSKPQDLENWSFSDKSLSLATNIYYSVSWPETPFGKGPFVNYQMFNNWNASLNNLTWEYIVGFNLAGAGISSPDIRQLSGDEIINYIILSSQQDKSFSVGFNSRVYDRTNFQNISGMSYQGNATITNLSVIPSVPLPAAHISFLMAFLVLIFITKKQREIYI